MGFNIFKVIFFVLCVLFGFLDSNCRNVFEDSGSSSLVVLLRVVDIFDYWVFYVCVFVCWVFNYGLWNSSKG